MRLIPKKQENLGHLQTAARHAYESRWWALRLCVQQDALAATLVDDAVVLLDGHDGNEPIIIDVLVDERFLAR